MLTASQFRRARLGMGWSVQRASEESGVAGATIRRIEDRGPDDSKVGNVRALEEAYRSAGVRFDDENGFVCIPDWIYRDEQLAELAAQFDDPDD